MTNWQPVPSLTAQAHDTVAIRHYDLGRRALHVSANLCTGPRATVLTDGNGKLAVRFGEHEAVSVQRLSCMGRIPLRKLADGMIPSNVSGPVPWHYEDGMVVIDTAQLRR